MQQTPTRSVHVMAISPANKNKNTNFGENSDSSIDKANVSSTIDTSTDRTNINKNGYLALPTSGISIIKIL